MRKKLLKLTLVFIFLFSFYTQEINCLFSNNNIVFSQDQNENKNKNKQSKKEDEVDYTKYCWNLESLYRSDKD